MKYDEKNFVHMPPLQYDIHCVKIGRSKCFINSALHTLVKRIHTIVIEVNNFLPENKISELDAKNKQNINMSMSDFLA